MCHPIDCRDYVLMGLNIVVTRPMFFIMCYEAIFCYSHYVTQ